jgi:hypothetical protein
MVGLQLGTKENRKGLEIQIFAGLEKAITSHLQLVNRKGL